MKRLDVGFDICLLKRKINNKKTLRKKKEKKSSKRLDVGFDVCLLKRKIIIKILLNMVGISYYGNSILLYILYIIIYIIIYIMESRKFSSALVSWSFLPYWTVRKKKKKRKKIK
jgi:hypothetical protein